MRDAAEKKMADFERENEEWYSSLAIRPWLCDLDRSDWVWAAAEESDMLAEAAESKTMDVSAQKFCEEHIQGPEMIAAIDSTAGEVREIATQVETRGPWQEGLPPKDEQPVSICIFDVAGLPGLEEGLTYMAY